MKAHQLEAARPGDRKGALGMESDTWT